MDNSASLLHLSKIDVKHLIEQISNQIEIRGVLGGYNIDLYNLTLQTKPTMCTLGLYIRANNVDDITIVLEERRLGGYKTVIYDAKGFNEVSLQPLSQILFEEKWCKCNEKNVYNLSRITSYIQYRLIN